MMLLAFLAGFLLAVGSFVFLDHVVRPYRNGAYMLPALLLVIGFGLGAAVFMPPVLATAYQGAWCTGMCLSLLASWRF